VTKPNALGPNEVTLLPFCLPGMVGIRIAKEFKLKHRL
jgi:hypothetical protein